MEYQLVPQNEINNDINCDTNDDANTDNTIDNVISNNVITNVTVLYDGWCGYYATNKPFNEVSYVANKIVEFMFILFLMSFVIIIIMVSLTPHNDSVHYCDNSFVQCDYFKTYGIVNNNSEISSDSILYIYDYNYNHNNYSCYHRENYELPYVKMHELLNEQIGKPSQIFVNKKHFENCILNYVNYDVERTKYNHYYRYYGLLGAKVCSMTLICFAISVYYMHYLHEINHKLELFHKLVLFR